MTLSSHACNCKCHLSSVTSMQRPSSQEISGQGDDQEKNKMYKKLDFLRKALADAEMRLSQAYKEMAELRRKSLAGDDSVSDMPKMESGGESSGEEEDKTSKEPSKDKKKVAKEPKRKKNVRRKSIKPKKKDKSLPPISQPIIPEPEVPPPPEFDDNRDNELWQVGDIQGRLNMLVTAITSYVTDIGKLIWGEEENGKKAVVQQFQFGQKLEDKAVKNANNRRAAERRQRRDQVMLNGQRAVAIIREVYDMLTAALELQHSDFEAIYRSFKQHQQIRAVHHAAMMGRLPQGNNVVRMGSSENAVEYYLKSYGGGGGAGIAGGQRGASGQPSNLLPVGSKIDLPLASSKASLQSGMGFRIEDGMVYGMMKRSKSDLHLYDDTIRPGAMPLMTGERAPVFMMAAQEPRQDVVGGNKEEVSLPMATVPKKGLIKLTAVDQELPDQEMLSMKRNEPASKKTVQKSLIKRKDIQEQIRAGTQMLEEEERRRTQDELDEGEVHLEDYTMGDLQTALNMVQDDSNSPVMLDLEDKEMARDGPPNPPSSL
ncbi:uncharacterized protein LOC124286853 isoform X2 [Haliotis rubra]|uniref:uncharacterized protein LOC124286853 isoform X2 n=1 Tax=Haliotis rubra TaxID=36100 RepID=UPI001EE5DE7A|nr:uncharacterized protein LOC124286853 isoform X2 [Haliotis rubra]